MILVDKDIQAFIDFGNTEDLSYYDKLPVQRTAIFQGEKECITNIGYDLRAASFSDNGKMVDTIELQPGESTFVQSIEIIAFDPSTIGKVIIKNSRIRMGLTIDAPIYQPGHLTNIYFRVTNISSSTIKMSNREKYAMIIFEQLDTAPIKPYMGSYQKEFSFVGLGDYKSAYSDQIQSLDGKVKNIHDVEKRIYSNVITIMTILIGVFSILNLNINLATSASSIGTFIAFNLATLGAMSFLAILLDELINRHTKKGHKLWIVPIVCLIIAIGLYFIKID